MDQMFIEEHAAFAAILDAQRLPDNFSSLIERIVKSDLREKSVLDLCCGHGRVSRAIAPDCKSVTAADYSAPLLEHGQVASANLENINWVCLDARKAASALNSRYDVILRLYTSLGYFSFEEELQILKQCHDLRSPNATLVYDSFNGDWFRKNKQFARKRNLGSIDLEESYTLQVNGDSETCACKWDSSKFNRPIEFELELYDESRVFKLFEESGWRIQSIQSSIDGTVSLPKPWERLIIVATE